MTILPSCTEPFYYACTGHRRLPAALASDSDSEDDSSSSPGVIKQGQRTMRSMRTAEAPAQDCLENALVVWQFQSIVRELMDVEAAEEAAGHVQEPNQQEQHVQSDTTGAGGHVSVENDTEARRTADEVTIAAVQDHETGLQGAAELINQGVPSGHEEATD